MNADNKTTVAEIKNDLLTNPKYQDFWKRFHSEIDKNHFIDTYSQDKEGFLNYGSFYYKRKLDWEKEVEEDANRFLGIILQKKLFDKQCLWRAEKIKIPEVKLCCDFMFWEANITNCPFLDPITDKEYKLLCTFINEKVTFTTLLIGHSWQDYPEPSFDLLSHTESVFETWYSEYDLYFNKPDYVNIFNDIRSEKEYRYETRPQMPDDLREAMFPTPGIGLYDHMNDAIADFMKQFEKRQLHEYREAYIRQNGTPELNDAMEDALDIIAISCQPLPISNNKDWREGIFEVAGTYWKKKLFETLDKAYKQYLKTGKLPPLKTDISFEKELMDMEHARVIKARIQMGEPGNLDF